MAGLYPLSRQQQVNSNSRVLGGARLFLFDGGTSTPRIGYRDLALTSAHPNPIVADSAGRLPLIYLADGFYRHRLTTSTGTLVFDDDGIPVLTTSAGGAGTTVDPDALFKTRDIKIRFDTQPLAGYVRLNGRTIGSATSGATERANVDTQSLYEELWQFANISVPAGKGASAAADFAANKPLTLPNCQGNSIFGMPDMGGTADAAFVALLSGANTAEPGATGGADTVTLLQGNIPSYSLTGGTGLANGDTGTESTTHVHGLSASTGTESATHAHTVTINTTAVASGVGATALVTTAGTPVAFGTSNEDALHAHSLTSAPTTTESALHTHAITNVAVGAISISSGGSGVAVNKLPSLLTAMIYIRL